MTVNSSISDLINLRQQLIEVVDKFPEKRREEILFDKWSLKDVLAHLAGWDELTCNVINNLNNGKLSIWGSGVNEMNKISLEKRKNKKYSEIYNEFVIQSQALVTDYQTLPEDLWDKPLYPDKNFSPAKFLKIDIDHYREHLEEIKQKL